MEPPTLARVRLADDAPRERLDRAATRAFAAQLPTRAAAKRACKRGEILVDGAPAEPSRWTAPGMELALTMRRDTMAAVFELALPVVFEDDAMAVVVKPAGWPVSGNQHRTIAHALPFNLAPSPRPDALPSPWPAHRLDAPTSGLLAVGKTAAALAALNAAFAERAVDKRYRALVVGRLEAERLLDVDVGGRPACTRVVPRLVTPAVKCGWVTTVDAWPDTGRTHQIRRHLAAIGHPILGDRRYATAGPALRGSGLYLSAVGLTLPHPDGRGPVTARADEPPKFASFRRRERRRCARLRPGDAEAAL